MYEAKQAQLDHDIETANAELDRSKIVLQAARQEKKRKLQYEVIVQAPHYPSIVQQPKVPCSRWTSMLLQEKREKCVQYPKRSRTEAEIAAVHQEIEALQTETEQAAQEYEVSS